MVLKKNKGYKKPEWLEEIEWQKCQVKLLFRVLTNYSYICLKNNVDTLFLFALYENF